MALNLNDIISGVTATGASVAGGRASQQAAQAARQRQDQHTAEVAKQLRLGTSGPQGTTRSTNRGLTATLNAPTQRQFNVGQGFQTEAGGLGAGLAAQGSRIDPFGTTLPGPAGGGPGRSLDTARQVVQGDRAARQVAIQDAVDDAFQREIQRVGPPGRSTNFGSPSGKLGTTLQRLANANLIGGEQDAYNLYDTWLDQAQARTGGQLAVPGQVALAPNQAIPLPDISDVSQQAEIMSRLRPTTPEVPDQTLQNILSGISGVVDRGQARTDAAEDPLRQALIRNLGNQVVTRNNPLTNRIVGSILDNEFELPGF